MLFIHVLPVHCNFLWRSAFLQPKISATKSSEIFITTITSDISILFKYFYYGVDIRKYPQSYTWEPFSMGWCYMASLWRLCYFFNCAFSMFSQNWNIDVINIQKLFSFLLSFKYLHQGSGGIHTGLGLCREILL